MKAATRFSLALFLFLHGIVRAAGDRSLTVHECIAESLKQNPQLLSQHFTLQANKENIWKEQSGFYPQISGNATLRGYTGSPTGNWAVLGINDTDLTGVVLSKGGSRSNRAPFRLDWGWVGIGALTLNYPLYANGSIFGFNNPPAVAMAKANYKKQGWVIRLTEQDVIAHVVGSFYNTTAYLQKVELDRQNVELTRKRLEILEEELRLNLTLPQYVEIAKQQLAASQQLLETSEQRAEASERLLLELLGRPSKKSVHLDTSDPLMPALPKIDSLLPRVTEEHPSVAIQEAVIEEAKQQYRLAQTALYPSVNFQSQYSGGTAFGPTPLDQFYTGIAVDVPVFDFGHKLSAEHEALDHYKATQAELEEVRLTLREVVLNQLASIHTTEADLAELERSYVAAKTNQDLIQSEHDQGISTQLALVDAQLNLWQVKDQMVLARLQLRIEYANLQRLTGGVWVWNR
jgi:outer membrane protein TolC